MKTTHPIIIGIDTHKATHVAVAIDTQGMRLAALPIPTNPRGYVELERWSRSLGKVLAFGIEGTGSYGAGLSRSLLAQGHTVIGSIGIKVREVPQEYSCFWSLWICGTLDQICAFREVSALIAS